MRLCASLVVSLLLPLAEAAWVPCNVAACECAGYCLDSLRGKSYTLSSADQKEQCVLRSRRLSLSLVRARSLNLVTAEAYPQESCWPEQVCGEHLRRAP